MKTNRFERAIGKLYEAFHNGTLDAMNCKHCAVGNLCDNSNEWVNNRVFATWGDENRIYKRFNNKTGYSSKELAKIEDIFVNGTNENSFMNYISERDVKLGHNTKEEQKELQFKGLCEVIKYLAKLDNMPNTMDYTNLFERVNNKPKYKIIAI